MLKKLDKRRNNGIEDYLNKAVAILIKKAIQLKVDEIIIGWNKGIKINGIKNDSISGKKLRKVNQTFIQIPISKFKDKLTNKCRQHGKRLILLMRHIHQKLAFMIMMRLKK